MLCDVCCIFSLCFSCYGDHLDLHVLSHSFPTRRSSDLSLSVSSDSFTNKLEACWAPSRLACIFRARIVTQRSMSNIRPPFSAARMNSEACCSWPSSSIRRSNTSKCWRASPSRLALDRSEEHTSELQSLMRISYAVFFLKKKQ